MSIETRFDIAFIAAMARRQKQIVRDGVRGKLPKH